MPVFFLFLICNAFHLPASQLIMCALQISGIIIRISNCDQLRNFNIMMSFKSGRSKINVLL